MRIGFGYDSHRLAEGRDFILGGVKIPFEKGLLGHSDADVLTHAVIDALLGATANKDIGRHFPDTDDKYKGVSSVKLLRTLWKRSATGSSTSTARFLHKGRSSRHISTGFAKRLQGISKRTSEMSALRRRPRRGRTRSAAASSSRPMPLY